MKDMKEFIDEIPKKFIQKYKERKFVQNNQRIEYIKICRKIFGYQKVISYVQMQILLKK